MSKETLNKWCSPRAVPNETSPNTLTIDLLAYSITLSSSSHYVNSNNKSLNSQAPIGLTIVIELLICANIIAHHYHINIDGIVNSIWLYFFYLLVFCRDFDGFFVRLVGKQLYVNFQYTSTNINSNQLCCKNICQPNTFVWKRHQWQFCLKKSCLSSWLSKWMPFL